MSRKRVVTTVTVDPAVFENAKELGLNFSRVLDQALIDSMEPQKQIDRLEGEIMFHEREILKLKEEVKVLKQIDNKNLDFVFEELVDRTRSFYELHGYIPKDVLAKFSLRMRKGEGELEEELLCYFSA